jgi:urease accessory protein
MNAALLLLSDSRLPAGGHAHSGSAEEAVRAGAITGTEDLARFLRGRLATAGLVAAGLAAAASLLANEPPGAARAGWRGLDAEADARTASPAQRAASRTQGRLLLRSARRIWPAPIVDGLAEAVPEGAHHAVALGAVAATAGCSAEDAAMAAAYNAITGAATAAVRLLGLDPVAVHRLLADLAPALERTAARAALEAKAPPDAGPASAAPPPSGADRHDWAALPSHAAPALDLLAEHHLRREVRLFVS